MASVRYIVIATLRDKDVLEEYVNWLKNGHIQAVMKGGATTGEVFILDSEDGKVKVGSSYEFPSRETLQAYFDGPAIELRKEGVELFYSNGKVVSFERTIGDIALKL